MALTSTNQSVKPVLPTKNEHFKNEYFAEVIESSLHSFLAQSWEWDHFPSFGALVQVENKQQIIMGTVTELQTGSMDPTRYPFPYKKTEEELLAQQPQIFEFLKTTFKVHIIGYIDKTPTETGKAGTICYLLPPKPSKIHAFVAETPQHITTQFFSKPDFLHLLFAFESQIPNLDELLLAILKHLASHQLLTDQLLEQFSSTFSLLSGNDYRRLKLFLRRIETSL